LKLVFAASPLSTQHLGSRAKTCWLRIRMICQSGAALWKGSLNSDGQQFHQ